MTFTVIIPSRYQSTRLPGKPLVDLSGQSMIQRVWEQSRLSGASRIIIATDDPRIEDVCRQFGGETCMTKSSHQSGTDRLAEVVEKCQLAKDEIVVNVQGDEPMIPPENIKQVAQLLALPSNAPMATLCTPIDNIQEISDPNAVKVVISDVNTALYFSRAAIPFDRDHSSQQSPYYRHIGIYAYRADFLSTFSQWPMSTLETIEKLEQLRVLTNGYSINIAVAEIIPPAGIDSAEDVERVLALLHSKDE